MIGQTISHYKILEKLGEGGMGVVYKAEDTKLNRIVALKFLPHHLTGTEDERARFLQEAQAAAVLNHPNVCTIYRIDEWQGDQFIEMEYVDGETLRRKIPVPKLDDALRYAVQIGEALQEAHNRGIVHRDVKSDNIMVNSRNQIKVMDFGLAKLKGSLKLTRTSSTVGTLAYMAPEQVQGGEVDARSDIFSFGIVLFEMLAGHTPFHGEHEAAILYSIVNEEPESVLATKPDLSPELDRILRRALEKDPEDRYQSIADMVSELRRLQKQTTRVIRPSETSLAAGPSRTGESTRTAIRTAAASDPISGSHDTAPARRRMPVVAIVIGAVILIIAAAAFFYFKGGQKPIDSLAVLPFESVGASADQEYLSDGLTENIINNLTRLGSLRVVPRSTVFRFKGKDMDIQEIGTKLNVSAVLTGRITHRGEGFDVQVDLIDIKHESQLWGNNYTSSVAGLLTLQEQITREVATQIAGSAPSVDQAVARHRPTDNTQAYQLYLQGRYFWNKRTGAAIERAETFFHQAIALDSNYALAYAGLADCYIVQSQYSGTPTSITNPQARQAAEKALELDSTLVEARTTLAFAYFEEWNYGRSEEEFKHALAINPKYPTALHWYNILLARAGRFDEAEKVITQAHEIDPYSPVITLNVGALYLLRGKYQDALPYFLKSVETEPSFAPGYAWAGRAYEQLKNPAAARPMFEKAVELSGRSAESVGYLGFFWGQQGQRDSALKLIDENLGKYRSGKGAAYNVAIIYAGLGDKENTIKWLQQDVEDHSTFVTSMFTDDFFDLVKQDPRYIALKNKVGLIK